MKKEEWRSIVGYEGLYEISNFGKVKSLHKVNCNSILKPHLCVGYLKVGLSKEGKTTNHFIHRLVGRHFIPNTENKPTINHIDGIKLNNSPENLEWANMNRQALHAIEIGLRKITSKRIIQMDINGNFIREWESTTIAGKNGFRASCINKAITGTQKHHKKYLWKYAES
jgi:hypothetical protein